MLRSLSEPEVSIPLRDDATTRQQRRARRVRFADSCGKLLETIRFMREPSDCPPMLASTTLRRVLGRYYDEGYRPPKPISKWLVDFLQPFRDYAKFREHLEANNVALENVIVANDVNHMSGTIKVKNLAFTKKVFVRITGDNWATYTDHSASFLLSISNAIDVFSFNIPLPTDGSEPDSRIEFCVCYRAEPDDGPAQEFWDSRGGANYCLISHERTGIDASPTHYYPYIKRPASWT